MELCLFFSKDSEFLIHKKHHLSSVCKKGIIAIVKEYWWHLPIECQLPKNIVNIFLIEGALSIYNPVFVRYFTAKVLASGTGCIYIQSPSF